MCGLGDGILIPGGHTLLASSGFSTGERAKTPSRCRSENTLRFMLSRKLLISEAKAVFFFSFNKWCEDSLLHAI